MIKTHLHTYRFDISKEDEEKAYNELRDELNDGRDCFNVINALYKSPITAGPIELETTCLFSNQWNSTTHRVFDWYEGIVPNKNIKQGHYLDITEDMKEIRRNTNKCGYCGHQESIMEGNIFCNKCLDSPHLKKKDLFLLRMLPVEIFSPKYRALTKAELSHILPLYIKRQTEGGDSRAVQNRKKQTYRIIVDKEKAIKEATIKHDGLMWLIHNNMNIDNVIYYSHSNKFCFGWQSPVSQDVMKELLHKLEMFPFDYEIKTEKARS